MRDIAWNDKIRNQTMPLNYLISLSHTYSLLAFTQMNREPLGQQLCTVFLDKLGKRVQLLLCTICPCPKKFGLGHIVGMESTEMFKIYLYTKFTTA